MRILHISSENTAGVPLTLVRVEREKGYYSRLMTYFKSPHSHGDDLVLNLPLSNTRNLLKIKKIFRLGTYEEGKITKELPIWRPNKLEKAFYDIRDRIWENKIGKYIDFIHSFDIYILEGGLGFLRSGKIIKGLKRKGKKIGIIYMGSDLRIRGAIKEIEDLADEIFTVELDHTFFHKNVDYIFFPFEVYKFKMKELKKGRDITICQAPTNRFLKGTKYLIEAYNSLREKYPIMLDIMENLSHKEVLKRKYYKCDILVDQLTDLGGFGYGINSLEALSMGIPCVTYLNPSYESFIPDHPFINANPGNLRDKLEEIIVNEDIRREKGVYGREWVQKYHDARNVDDKILSKLVGHKV